MKDQINFHAKYATEHFPEMTDYPIIYPWFMREKIGKKHTYFKNRTTSAPYYILQIENINKIMFLIKFLQKLIFREIGMKIQSLPNRVSPWFCPLFLIDITAMFVQSHLQVKLFWSVTILTFMKVWRNTLAKNAKKFLPKENEWRTILLECTEDVLWKFANFVEGPIQSNKIW